MGDGSGSDKRCILTQAGSAKLEAALDEHFGESPSDSQVARAFGLDRGTVSKIRTPNRKKPTTRNSLETVFDALGLDLQKEDYQQVATPKSAKQQKIAPNPFGTTRAITDPTKFWGRQELLRQIFEELGKGGSRALIGPPRCGKSSLLQMICQQGPERLDRESEAFIHMDMNIVQNAEDFFEELCTELDIDPPCKPSQLKRKLTHPKQKQHYVICLDEIHALSNEAFFPEPTRNWLRGMAEMPDSPIQLVVASQRELRELFPDRPNRSSPLADFFDGQTTRLEYLNEAEVITFWEEGLAGTRVVASAGTRVEQGRRLWAESEGNLRSLQRSAAKLYDELCGNR